MFWFSSSASPKRDADFQRRPHDDEQDRVDAAFQKTSIAGSAR